MSALCLFGALCSVNPSLFLSNRNPVGLPAVLDLDTQSSDQHYASGSKNPTNTFVESPSQSPCPYVFRYIQDSNEWKGEVTLENIDIQRDTNLRVEITIPKTLRDKNIGTIQLTTSIEESMNNILNNRPLIYRVNFPTQNPLPKVKNIYYNENIICKGPGDTGSPVTIIKLSNIFKSGQLQTSTRPNYQTQTPVYQTKRPAINYQTTIQQEPHHQLHNNKFPTKPTVQPNYIESPAEDVACGTPILGLAQSLVFGGKAVSRGQWPWLVAFYKAGRGNLEFICGGNLISRMHVITAAHCIQDKQSNKKREAETGVVYVGKHNLDNWNEQGSEKRGVERFIVNDEWKPFDIKYDADIAIIVMDSAVEYSQYVRPVCVWEFSDNLNDVVGQRGILAGWGLNENFILNSEFPKTIEVPIVSDGTCLRSNPAILAISTERTFCAGGKNGEGPCSGDSGGGLILKNGNKYYLRGLVSSSPRAGTSPCDPNSFAVFTDVAKFSSWIQTNTQ